MCGQPKKYIENHGCELNLLRAL